jgi:hypothetical protein
MEIFAAGNALKHSAKRKPCYKPRAQYFFERAVRRDCRDTGLLFLEEDRHVAKGNNSKRKEVKKPKKTAKKK